MWSPNEAILLLPSLDFDSHSVNTILGGWFEARKHLLFEIVVDQIPTGLTIAQVYTLFTCFCEGEENLSIVFARGGTGEG